MPWLPRHEFLDWPEEAANLSPAEIRQLYESGHAGAKYSPEAWQLFRTSFTHPVAEEAAYRFGLVESGAGKLVIPFVFVMEMFPGCWPGPGQGRGDCVTHSTKNGLLTSMSCDILSGQPDEKTGLPEEKPEVSEEAIAQGVLSSEALYWYRRHGGEGWYCPEAATVACKESGIWIRKNYPELGFDLTRYDSPLAGKWGRTPPPANITEVGRLHLAHQATEATTLEAVRDLLYNGYGCSTCGSEGYNDKRDEWGLSKQQGSWAHAMACVGVDDRDAIKQKYGEPLVLILNSWAKWNSGPRDIYQSASLVPPDKKDLWIRCGIVNASTGNLMIPEGSFWTPWSHARRREYVHFSGVNGWPRKTFPGSWSW